ncbi:unnamed protein product [Natator depressus]
MPPCVTVLIIGAGCRGKHYSYFAVHFPNRMKVVGVADPHAFARNDLQKIHCIDKKNVFNDWKVATERERFADAVIIATPDRLHKDPAIAFANKGYHILLEKPMAVTPEDCKEIVSVCKANNVMLAVCHVLRYYPASLKIKELLDAGAIGDICHIQHLEPVGFWHFAHSFVRGNWRNEAESTFSLLAKSCHDIDLIHFWMGDKRCLKVSSFGSLSHFTNEHKPKGAASRCLDCSVEQTCPYSAKKIYLQRAEKLFFPRVDAWTVVLGVILALLVVLIALAGYCFWRQHREKDKLQAELRWRSARLYTVDVTLDPNTAHPSLVLSEDQKTVTYDERRQDRPDNPERFNTYPIGAIERTVAANTLRARPGAAV